MIQRDIYHRFYQYYGVDFVWNGQPNWDRWAESYLFLENNIGVWCFCSSKLKIIIKITRNKWIRWYRYKPYNYIIISGINLTMFFVCVAFGPMYIYVNVLAMAMLKVISWNCRWFSEICAIFGMLSTSVIQLIVNNCYNSNWRWNEKKKTIGINWKWWLSAKLWPSPYLFSQKTHFHWIF